jgi:hypothetical protein
LVRCRTVDVYFLNFTASILPVPGESSFCPFAYCFAYSHPFFGRFQDTVRYRFTYETRDSRGSREPLTADRSTTELRWIALGDAEHTLASPLIQGKRRLVQKKSCSRSIPLRNWLRGLDLNQRPSGYEPDELPGCSTPRDENTWDVNALQIEKPSNPDETHLSFATSRLR